MDVVKINSRNYLLILLTSSLSPIVAYIYLSALPHLVIVFNTDPNNIKLTLAFYILGLGLSYLINGPISDRIGRRKPLLLGVGGSIIGSVICASSTHISLFILGRFVQGICLGACGSAGRAVMRDYMSGNNLARFSSQIAMLSTFIMAASPLIGSYLDAYSGWRSIFVFLIMYTIAVWLYIFKYFNDTFSPPQYSSHFKMLLKSYKTIITNREFINNVIISSCAYSCLILYFVNAPFIYQIQYKLSKIQFGWMSYLVTGAIFFASFLNAKCIMNFDLSKMIRYGAYLILFSSLGLLVYTLLYTTQIVGFSLFLIVLTIGAGLLFSNTFSAALEPFPELAATASGIYGACQLVVASMSLFIFSFFMISQHEMVMFSLSLFVLSIISVVCAHFISVHMD